jgi:hypothetical protein
MSISIYKPNSKNAGCAFNFSVSYQTSGGKPPSLYINAIQQATWDDQRKIGSFTQNKEDADKNIAVKFHEFEIGAIISALKTRVEYSTLHVFDENKTSIKFAPWDKKQKVSSYDPKTKNFSEKEITVPAFGINFTRNGNQTFKIPLEPGEVEVVKNFLTFVLNKINQYRFDNRKNFSQKESSPAAKPVAKPAGFEEDAPF